MHENEAPDDSQCHLLLKPSTPYIYVEETLNFVNAWLNQPGINQSSVMVSKHFIDFCR